MNNEDLIPALENLANSIYDLIEEIKYQTILDAENIHLLQENKQLKEGLEATQAKLKPKQELFLQELMKGQSQIAAAKAVGIAEATATRWLKNPIIQAEKARRKPKLELHGAEPQEDKEA